MHYIVHFFLHAHGLHTYALTQIHTNTHTDAHKHVHTDATHRKNKAKTIEANN
jgi:hypothetical protein